MTCSDCGCDISDIAVSGMCVSCFAIKAVKAEREGAKPPKDDAVLLNDDAALFDLNP